MKSVALLALLPGVLVTASQQPAVAARQLEGRWRICFVLDSSVSGNDRSSRMTCGQITFGRTRKMGGPPTQPSDTLQPGVWMKADHDLHFTPMLGAEPGSGPVGSGTVLSGGGFFTLALNMPGGMFVLDDHSVHARGDLTRSDVLKGTWQQSCLPACPERGAFVMRRLNR
jgi:hypothetical protein